MVQVPDVFLLDEPLGDLDAVQRTEVRRQIVEVVRSLGVPTFYVTHDPGEGLAIADRVALLHEGVIVQVGRPRELYERPVNLFVAEFVGDPTIGLLPARLVVGRRDMRASRWARARCRSGGECPSRWPRTSAATSSSGCEPRTCRTPGPGTTRTRSP